MTCVKNLEAATRMQDLIVKIAGQNYCSGGCAANAYHATGTIRGIYEPGCELFRKRIECAIMMKVAEDAEKGG